MAQARQIMMSKQRLTKEYKQILSEPIDHCIIKPDTKNIFQWHFVIDGIKDTPLEGGKYYGRIEFTNQYPFKAPNVFIDTKNGLITAGESICMSMTSWHEESWNSAWGPRTIVLGLFVFLEDCLNGRTSSATMIYDWKKPEVIHLAKISKQTTLTLPTFITMFPELVDEWKNGTTTGTTPTDTTDTKTNVVETKVESDIKTDGNVSSTNEQGNDVLNNEQPKQDTNEETNEETNVPKPE